MNILFEGNNLNCKHPHKRWTGEMPCTGSYKCLSCGAIFDARPKATEEEYQKVLSRALSLFEASQHRQGK